MRTSDGFADTTVNGVTVTIDGMKAPLLYASAEQISVQVPYEATSRAMRAPSRSPAAA